MFTRALLMLVLLGHAALAGAQDMRLDVLGDGTLVFGIATAADGTPAANAAVQMALSAAPQTPVATVQTDAAGVFSWTGAPTTGYDVRLGTTTVSITTGEAPPQPFQWPPIYITLGALLMLSLIPARLLRRKELR